jgi:hypothetical protein
MPNHLHLMVKIKSEEALKQAYINFQAAKNIMPIHIIPLPQEKLSFFISKPFGNLFSSYTQVFNKQQNRKGNFKK